MIDLFLKRSLVSVIIPVYNRVDTIMKTINSALNQTYKDIELIIVDDGSTDGTLELLRELENEKIQVLEQKHKGANEARNFGIKMAKGEYIALLDSADTWYVNKIEKQLECLRKNPEFDMVFCVEKVNIRDEGFFIPSNIQKDQIKQGKLKEVLAKGNCIDTSTIFCKRSCFEKIGKFDVDLLRYQDYELVIRAVQKCSICFWDECLAEANVRKDSISSDINKSLDAVPRIYNKHQKYFAQHGTDIDFLMIPIWELYYNMEEFSYYEKYFELLNRYIDIQWRSKIEDVYNRTFKFIFSENVGRQCRIWNYKEGYDVISLLNKDIKFNIFGAGEIAKKFYNYLQKKDKDELVMQTIVTFVKDNQEIKEGLPIIEVKQCDENIKAMPIVLALNSFNMLEVIEKLKKEEFKRIVVLSWDELEQKQ